MKVVDINNEKEMSGLIDALTVTSMKANYVDYVQNYGCEEANLRMAKMFDVSWLKHKETVWQWFDIQMEMVREKA
jgi:hypothetical protein